jgi:hypothetical protein
MGDELRSARATSRAWSAEHIPDASEEAAVPVCVVAVGLLSERLAELLDQRALLVVEAARNVKSRGCGSGERPAPPARSTAASAWESGSSLRT